MMANNLDGKERMNPVLEESFSGDGTIVGVFPAGEINPIDRHDSLSRDNDETVRIFPGAGINVPIDQDGPFFRDDGIIAAFPSGINPIPMENSSARDEGTVGIFPPPGINPITVENSSSRDDGIVGNFPAAGINIPINMENSSNSDDGILAIFPPDEINPINMENSSSMDDDGIVGAFPASGINLIDSFSRNDGIIVGVFPQSEINIPINIDNSSSSKEDGIIAVFPAGGGTEETNCFPDDCSAEAGNRTPIVIIPSEVEENPVSDQEVKCPSNIGNEQIDTKPGFVPETRKEPQKRGISRGSSGGTH